MDSRKQLLQSLMRDLEDFKLPERFDDAKKAEIARGRKTQAQIDEGRKTVIDNERAYQSAVEQRGKLQERIAKLQGEIDAADTKAKQDDPVNQALQLGKSVGIPAAGFLAGHAAGKSFGKSFDMPPKERAKGVNKLAESIRKLDKTAPASKAAQAAAVDTYDKTLRRGRSPAQFIGPAVLGGMSLATQAGSQYADDPYLKEGLNLAANAERYGAGGMALQQVIDTLRGGAEARRAVDPLDVSTIEAARREVNAGGKFDKVQGALRDQPPAPPAAKAPNPGTRDALYRDAKARGLPVNTRMKKGELETIMAKALRASSKAPKAIVPLAVGAGVYDAMRTPAAAAEGEAPAMATPGAAAAAGGAAAAATGGLMAGGRAIADRAMQSPAIATVLRGLGRVAGPAAGALTAYDAGSAVLGGLAQGEDVAGADAALRQGNPSFHGQQEALRQGAYGETPAAPEPPAELQQLVETAEQDPELAEMLKALLLERVEEANADPMANAMASQAVAQQGGVADALRTLAMR
jgi:hypothetical protein